MQHCNSTQVIFPKDAGLGMVRPGGCGCNRFSKLDSIEFGLTSTRNLCIRSTSIEGGKQAKGANLLPSISPISRDRSARKRKMQQLSPNALIGRKKGIPEED